MPEMCPPLTTDPSTVCRAEVNAVVDGFVVQVAGPDSRHNLQCLNDVADETPDDGKQQHRTSDRKRNAHEEILQVSRGAMVFVMKRAQDAPEAMKYKPVQHILEKGPENDAHEKREHMAMLSHRA